MDNIKREWIRYRQLHKDEDFHKSWMKFNNIIHERSAHIATTTTTAAAAAAGAAGAGGGGRNSSSNSYVENGYVDNYVE